MRMISGGGKRILLIGLVLSLWMAGCKPAILNSSSSDGLISTQQATQPPTLQFPTPVCRVSDETETTPAPVDYGYPPVTEEDWIEGGENAPLTLTFYGDFLCPYSADLDMILAQLITEYPDDLRVVFRQLPIQESYLPALAIEAAGMQSVQAVHPLRHFLFAHQADWIVLTGEEFLIWLEPNLVGLGLDVERFQEDILSDVAKQYILDDLQSAAELEIPGTPFVLINQKPYTGIRDEESLRDILLRYQSVSDPDYTTYAACPAQVIETGKALQARITTTRGALMVELYAEQVPFTVNNFVFLARQGWYDNSPFFRVIPGTMLQSGDPSGTGSGNAGYVFGNEIRPNLQFDQPGLLAMANSGSADPISNSSQFFITYDAMPEYTGGYTIFGKVIAGLEILNKFPATDPTSGAFVVPPDHILSIEILEEE